MTFRHTENPGLLIKQISFCNYKNLERFAPLYRSLSFTDILDGRIWSQDSDVYVKIMCCLFLDPITADPIGPIFFFKKLDKIYCFFKKNLYKSSLLMSIFIIYFQLICSFMGFKNLTPKNLFFIKF